MFRETFLKLHQRRVEILISGQSEALADEIREIRAAIMRMHRGTYGRCNDCELPIQSAHLILDPLKQLCARCEFRAMASRSPCAH